MSWSGEDSRPFMELGGSEVQNHESPLLVKAEEPAIREKPHFNYRKK
jgi:hypothetical protein